MLSHHFSSTFHSSPSSDFQLSPSAGASSSVHVAAMPSTAATTLLLLLSLVSSAFSSLVAPPPLPLPPLPTSSQLRWQLGEMALFLHFGINTFTDREWGDGSEPPSLFLPSSLDARQWAVAAVSAGFSHLVLTAKHHDGFCLWPSSYTNYSVTSSPWRGGRGDVVADLAAAARAVGLGMGVYLSPWDRHESCYGSTVAYNEFYLGQMRELLTSYGDIEEVFLDGAPGKDQTTTVYLFKTWFDFIHQLQPGAVIFSDSGPDSRWVGDEAGVAGTTCWSLFNISISMIGNTTYKYSTEGDPSGQSWVPAECDVSIRPGWFWHEDEHPKSALELLEIYYMSVGRNCLLILNVPPNSSGLISDEDLQVLHEFAELRKDIFSVNLAQDALVSASTTRGGDEDHSLFGSFNILQEGIYSYWAPEEYQPTWELYLDLLEPMSFNVIQIQEPIQMGQRIASFHIDTWVEGDWMTIVIGTTVGYKRLLRLANIQAQHLKLVIDESRADPLISYFGLYFDKHSSSRAGRSHNHHVKAMFNRTQIIGQVAGNVRGKSLV